MTQAKLSAVLAPAALGLVALGAFAGGLASPQTTIEGKKRPATVYIRPDVLGRMASGIAPALSDNKDQRIAGELITITSDSITLEVANDRIWIPRENVLAVYYDR